MKVILKKQLEFLDTNEKTKFLKYTFNRPNAEFIRATARQRKTHLDTEQCMQQCASRDIAIKTMQVQTTLSTLQFICHWRAMHVVTTATYIHVIQLWMNYIIAQS